MRRAPILWPSSTLQPSPTRTSSTTTTRAITPQTGRPCRCLIRNTSCVISTVCERTKCCSSNNSIRERGMPKRVRTHPLKIPASQQLRRHAEASRYACSLFFTEAEKYLDRSAAWIVRSTNRHRTESRQRAHVASRNRQRSTMAVPPPSANYIGAPGPATRRLSFALPFTQPSALLDE